MRNILFSKNTVIWIVLFTIFSVNAASFDRTKSAILVEDTNLDDKLKLKQVFAQIVVNNTGESISDILSNPVFLETNIKLGLKRSYVEQIDNNFLSENSPYKYWFYAVMQEKFIDKVIANAHFSVLPKNREKIMAWVVKNNEISQSKLTYAYDDEQIIYWLKHWAQVMGINIVFPKMDEVDSINVSPQSIKSLSFEAQKQAQGRYFVTHNLLLSIDNKAGKVKARSGYVYSGQDVTMSHFQDLTGDIGSLMYSVFEDLSQRFAQQYKIDSTNIQRHSIQIVINNLSSYDDIMYLEDYLKRLSVIDNSTIVSATHNQLVLTSELTVTTDSFLSMINRDNILSPIDQGSINQLVFSFNNL
jgi:hypothetical protein